MSTLAQWTKPEDRTIMQWGEILSYKYFGGDITDLTETEYAWIQTEAKQVWRSFR